METKASIQALRRLTKYLDYLRALPKDAPANISATAIAAALDLKDVQVRKDLALVSSGGRPRTGHSTKILISDIERYLGCNDISSVFIAGVGNLGRALMTYDGFLKYGLEIVAGFDNNEDVVGTTINNKHILPIDKLEELCQRMHVKIGIIAVPDREAQSVCDKMVNGGIVAILNMAPVHLNVPDNVLVQYEDMAGLLSVLSRRLMDRLAD